MKFWKFSKSIANWKIKINSHKDITYSRKSASLIEISGSITKLASRECLWIIWIKYFRSSNLKYSLRKYQFKIIIIKNYLLVFSGVTNPGVSRKTCEKIKDTPVTLLQTWIFPSRLTLLVPGVNSDPKTCFPFIYIKILLVGMLNCNTASTWEIEN